MLDEYVFGTVGRISPDTPVPVVDIIRRDYSLGGAGNVVKNIASLGATGKIVGVIGFDSQGKKLSEICDQTSGIVPHLYECRSRSTTTKTRVISRDQQLIRIDQETKQSVSSEMENKIISDCNEQLDRYHACILSDYSKGMLTQNITKSLIAICNQKKIPVIIDPKGSDFTKYYGATVLTPNMDEAYQATKNTNKNMNLEEVADLLQTITNYNSLLITQGPQGMTLFIPGSKPINFPATARYVNSVAGAGDTVVAVLAISLAAGIDIKMAVQIANYAAGIVVEKSDTSCVFVEELKPYLDTIQCVT